MKFDCKKVICSNILPLVIYSAIALIILGPMLGRGFILTLDMVFTPQIKLPSDTQSSSYLLNVGLHYLNNIFASDIIQKFILIFIIVCSGTGMHLLVDSLKPKQNNSDWIWSAYFAGIFYVFNPFVYDRFIAGQYNVLLGYALLPFFAKSLLVFLKTPGLKSSFALGIILWIIGVLSIHSIGLALVIAGSLLLSKAINELDEPKNIFKTFKYFALALTLFVLASSHWILPLLTGKSQTAELIESFDDTHFSAFSSHNDLAKIITLRGFWLEGRNNFIPPQDVNNYWVLICFFIGILILIGSQYTTKQHKNLAIGLVISSVIAIIFVLGPGNLIFGKFNKFLIDWAPFFKGYREPQKFSALLCLTYSIFGAFGINFLIAQIKYRFPKNKILGILPKLFVIAPILLMPIMLWGFYGQLLPRQYPASWFETNNYLNKDGDNFKVVFLPWHQYMHFGFAGRVIANPATKFFDKPIIVSADPEFEGIEPQTNDKTILELNELLANYSKNNLGLELKKHLVKYVILAKEGDFADYKFLNSQKDLKIISENSNFKIYLNKAF